MISGGRRSWLERGALLAGSLALFCAALSMRPAPTMKSGEDEWNRALQAARADREAADPGGKYFGVFVKSLGRIQGPAVRSCRERHPASASASFQAVARLSKAGTIQQLLVKPSSEFHDCLRDRIKAATLPEPPKAPYWIFWGSLAATGP